MTALPRHDRVAAFRKSLIKVVAKKSRLHRIGALATAVALAVPGVRASADMPVNGTSASAAIPALVPPLDVYTGLNGNWSDSQSWSLGRSPINGDAVLLAPALGTTYVSYDAINPVTLAKLTLNATGAASITLIQSQGILSVTGTETVGDNGIGAFLFGGGLHTAGGGLVLGNSTNGSGTYAMFGGVLKVKGTGAIIGSNGVFTQTDGVNETASLSLAPKVGSTATMNFGGGSFSVGSINVEAFGTSIINISGGVFAVNGSEHLSTHGTSGATVFNQSGGIHTIASGLEMGGVYNLSGGSVFVIAQGIQNFQGSTFNYSGGSLTVVQNEINNNGRFNLTGTGTRVVNGSFNNGGTVTVTKTIAEFSGAFSNSGAYVSQQSDNYFHDLIVNLSSDSKGPSFTAGPGDRFFISGNFSQPSAAPIYNVAGAEFHFSGGGIHQYTTSNSFKPLLFPTLIIDPGNTLNLAGGPAATLLNQGDVTVLPSRNISNVTVASLTGSGNLTVGGGTGFPRSNLMVGALNQNAVTINNDSKLTLAQGTQTVTATISSLNIVNGGTLEMNQSSLILNYGSNTSPLGLVRSWLTTGRAGGRWNGPGITSVYAALGPNRFGIGYTDAFEGFVPSLTPGQLLIRPAQYGDVNFDGKVDQADRDQITGRGHFNDGGSTHSWTDGDLNYDGKVNIADIRIIALSGNYDRKFVFVTPSILVPVLGEPSFHYDNLTGDVVIHSNQAVNVVDLHLFSAGSLFLPDNSTFTGFATKTKGELENVLLGSTFGDGYDLGNILPAGLTTESVQADVTAFFGIAGRGVEKAAAVVPEPAALSLAGVGSLSLLGRRRRARSS